jgi:hypothetical protein
MVQKSWQSLGEWHKALTKAECALPNIVWSLELGSTIMAELRWMHRAYTKAECALPNIVESLAWLKSLGRALAGGTELQPRLNVVRQTSSSPQLGSKLSAELWRIAPSFDQG